MRCGAPRREARSRHTAGSVRLSATLLPVVRESSALAVLDARLDAKVVKVVSDTADDDSCLRRLDTQFAGRALTELETATCKNCLRQSQHTRMRMMPNHHVDADGNLQGFFFECNSEDRASVLPVSAQMFSATAVYEVQSSAERAFNTDVLRLFSSADESQCLMQAVADELERDPTEPALFECIGEPDDGEDGVVPRKIEDHRAWAPSVPAKMGLYHSFSRSYANDKREHRLFIVVTGGLRQAAEQLNNLWLDCAASVSAREFVQAEETQWLRTATVRSLNRVAALIAQRFGLHVHTVVDHEDPRGERMALPSLVTRHHDMDIVDGRVRLTSSAALTDTVDSGVVLDLFSSEGTWVFMGPRNTTEFNVFGSMLAHRADAQAFPTRSVRFSALYPSAGLVNTVKVRASPCVIHSPAIAPEHFNEFMVPDEQFYRITEQLGFNRNDGILCLMPVICFVTDEPNQACATEEADEDDG
jgi:hypothetical protein